MTLTLEYIKKLIGWCPNAKTAETGSLISLSNFEAYDRSGGEKGRSQNVRSRLSRLFSRLDVRILLPIIFLTPFYINFLFQKRINAEAFFLGLSLFLLIYFLCWKKQMRQYDALAKKPIVGSPSKKLFFWIFLTLILFLIFTMFFWSYIPFFNARSLYSFTAGAWVLMWGNYLQLIYWERKNHMKIYTINENGFQKTYAVWKNEEEL